MVDSRVFSFDLRISDDVCGDLLVSASGSISTFYPATMYRPNGDPGDDSEGGDIEYDELYATDSDGNDIPIPARFMDLIDDKAYSSAKY